jgi:hypothetical protein
MADRWDVVLVGNLSVRLGKFIAPSHAFRQCFGLELIGIGRIRDAQGFAIVGHFLGGSVLTGDIDSIRTFAKFLTQAHVSFDQIGEPGIFLQSGLGRLEVFRESVKDPIFPRSIGFDPARSDCGAIGRSGRSDGAFSGTTGTFEE